MNLDQLFEQLDEIGAVVIINNLTVTVNGSGNGNQAQDYAPSPWQIAEPPKQAHRWAGHHHPYDICECGVMTRNFRGHIVEMAGK